MAKIYTAEEVRAMLRKVTQKHGVNWLANELYLSAGTIWYCLNGKRAPSPAVLDYLGLEKITLYRRKDDGI
jgi:hypothetical protein